MTTLAAGGFAPADPTTVIRHAADRLAALPDSPLAAALIQLLTAAAAEMDGRGAYELLSTSTPQVCARTGPRPVWTAALALARAVLADRPPVADTAGTVGDGVTA